MILMFIYLIVGIIVFSRMSVVAIVRYGEGFFEFAVLYSLFWPIILTGLIIHTIIGLFIKIWKDPWLC